MAINSNITDTYQEYAPSDNESSNMSYIPTPTSSEPASIDTEAEEELVDRTKMPSTYRPKESATSIEKQQTSTLPSTSKDPLTQPTKDQAATYSLSDEELQEQYEEEMAEREATLLLAELLEGRVLVNGEEEEYSDDGAEVCTTPGEEGKKSRRRWSERRWEERMQ